MSVLDLPPGWLVMDGAMGTEVERRGIDVDNPLWGSAALALDGGTEAVQAIHRDHVEAGAQLLIANTHNASRSSCAAYLFGGHPRAGPEPVDVTAFLEQINRDAVTAARRAAEPTTRIAACLMSPDRPYARRAGLDALETRDRLIDQARVLDRLGLDLILFEMLSTDADVEGVARVLPELRTPAGLGFTCGSDGRTHGGVDPSEAAKALIDAGAAAAFVQCTHHEHVLEPLEKLVATIDRPVGVYANDGRVWRDGAWHGAAIGPDAYAEKARTWIAAGARIVGGCCGTGPEHVRALAHLQAAAYPRAHPG